MQVYCTFISLLPLTFTVGQLEALFFSLCLFTFSLGLNPFVRGENLFWCTFESIIIVEALRGVSRSNVLYLSGCGLFIFAEVSGIQLLFCHVASEECKCCCWFRPATPTLSPCILRYHTLVCVLDCVLHLFVHASSSNSCHSDVNLP